VSDRGGFRSPGRNISHTGKHPWSKGGTKDMPERGRELKKGSSEKGHTGRAHAKKKDVTRRKSAIWPKIDRLYK